ncbi:hypothetical protein NIES4101_61990 [Calothrix sp. NIES-4101]|nr:hypothetical protein NIES4101_61990 [Calothrix sp. NIES-4101]
MVNEPKTSRYQIVSSMTPDEVISEGYGEYDDFYDPVWEERKKEIELEKEEARKNPKSEEYWRENYIEF